jgi:hypothetical protein
MADLNGVIVGVDLDGVCSDFYGRMREIAAEWFECPIDELTRDVSYGLPEWGVKSAAQYESLHRFAVTQRELFKTSPMIPGARRYLRLLSDERAPESGSSRIGSSSTISTDSPWAKPSTGSTNTESHTGTCAS